MGKKGCSSYILYLLARALNVSVNSLIQDNLFNENEEIETVYKVLESTQKDKITSILEIMYKMIEEYEG